MAEIKGFKRADLQVQKTPESSSIDSFPPPPVVRSTLDCGRLLPLWDSPAAAGIEDVFAAIELSGQQAGG